ncbi:MAG: hypothetical protein ACREF5_01560 [Candidatus Saccharimonadales bacterium]
MKQFLNNIKLTFSCVVFLCLVALIIPAPQYVHAAPIGNFAAAASTSCTLPDGSTGKTQTDGQTCCPANDEKSSSTTDTQCLFSKYVNPVIDLLSAAVGVVVVIAIIIGAIEYTSSAGDPQRSASGRQHIMNALLGLFAYFFLYAFLQFIVPGGLFNG